MVVQEALAGASAGRRLGRRLGPQGWVRLGLQNRGNQIIYCAEWSVCVIIPGKWILHALRSGGYVRSVCVDIYAD